MSLTWGTSPKLDTVKTREGLQVLGKNQAMKLFLVPDRPTTSDRFVTKTDIRNLWRGMWNAFLIASPLWVGFILWWYR